MASETTQRPDLRKWGVYSLKRRGYGFKRRQGHGYAWCPSKQLSDEDRRRDIDEEKNRVRMLFHLR